MKILKNIIKSTKFKFIVIISSLLALYVFICAFSYVQAVSENLSSANKEDIITINLNL